MAAILGNEPSCLRTEIGERLLRKNNPNTEYIDMLLREDGLTLTHSDLPADANIRERCGEAGLGRR